jgi:hypothetical protein
LNVLQVQEKEAVMAKLGTSTRSERSIHDAAHSETVAHKHVPGRAYDVSDPVQKLIHTIGGGFFNEPRYYETERSYEDFRKQLREDGKITKTCLDKMGLNESARELIETAVKVIEGPTPEDLLIVASWARDKKHGLKLRATPQIMLTLAAASAQAKPFVRKYTPAIVDRIDEIRQVFAAFRHLFCQQTEAGKAPHKGGLPHSLRKGLGQVLAEASPYELFKYNSEEKPTLKDVILMVSGGDYLPRRKSKDGVVQLSQWQGLVKDDQGKPVIENGVRKTQTVVGGWPLSKAMFEYLVNGKVLPDAPEVIKAREQFFKLTNVREVTPEMLEKAALTWENVTSKFGTSKEVWSLCIPIMGEMALTRNLRNFEQAGISKADWDKVYEKVGKVLETNQLPFRFFTALKQTSSTEARTLVSMQLDQSCSNVPELPGVTVVLCDNSGSAVGAVISGKSDMRVSDTGNTLGAILCKRLGRNCMMGVFGDSLRWVPFNQTDSCLSIKDKIDSVAQREQRTKDNCLAIKGFERGTGVGQGTETGLWWAIHDITEKKVKVDRIIMLSDLCCYTQGDINCGYKMSDYFGRGGEKATVQSMIDRYRREVNPGCFAYSINLHGYGQSQLKPHGERNYLLSGWSEQIFSLMGDTEGLVNQKAAAEEAEPVEVPTIEILRSRYKLA